MKMSNYRFKKANNKNNLARIRNQSVKRGRLLSYYHQQLMNYIYGLAHPELAINSPNIPKAPSYVSIPTSNITFREAFDINPDVNGEFILYWTPNFLCSQPQIEKRSNYAYTNYSRNWLGGYNDEHKEFGYYPVAAYAPPASFVKYRLVSAGCKITYKGPVIQRAGIISHCLTYKAFPMPFFKEDDKDWIGQSAYDGAADPTRWSNTLQNLDVTVIQNGMWSSIQNIQKNKTVFVCAVPTDPSDFIFEDDAYFYQAATATEDVERQIIHVQDVPQGAQEYDISMGIQLPEDGTPMSYIFKGTDLTNDAKLYVEQFYNFEVIPTEESAPILRPRTNDLSSDQLEKAKNTITKVLDLKKGNSSAIGKKLIDSFIEDPLYYIQPQQGMYPNDNNIITNQAQAKKVKNSFKNQVKNFGKSLLKESKNVLKDVSNVMFTKENAIKLGETIADMVLNKMSK
jgi:hypothetical protein